jgi:hypothetical protein
MAGAVADGVDMGDGRTPVLVGDDAGPRAGLSADPLEPKARDERPAADSDQHQVRCDCFAVTEVDPQLRPGVVDLGALRAQVQRDAAVAELLGQRAMRRRLPAV